MTEIESKKQLQRNIEYLKYSWKPHPDYDVLEAIGIAISSLEKRIPKKVKIQQWIYTKCDCGYEFSKHHGDGYYSIPLEKKTNYCPNCGQKLDWGNES